MKLSDCMHRASESSLTDDKPLTACELAAQAMTMPISPAPSPRHIAMAVLTDDAVNHGDAMFISPADEADVAETLNFAYLQAGAAAAGERLGEAAGRLRSALTGKPVLPLIL